MFRVGVRFENISPAERNQLDHFVFQQMRRVATQWRHLRGALYQPADNDVSERRYSRRMPVEGKNLQVKLEVIEKVEEAALTLGEQAKLFTEPIKTKPKMAHGIRICDISASGCAFLCPEENAPSPGTLLDINLSDEGISIHLQGRVVYASPTPASHAQKKGSLTPKPKP